VAPGREAVKRDAIDQVAEDIRQLRVDFERFFNGALVVPPFELSERIKTALRNLRNRPGNTFADQYRLTQLEARFNTYTELFNRRTRDREEGRTRVPSVAPGAPRHDPHTGIVVGQDLRPDAVEALYAGLARGQKQVAFDLESFRTYLSRQLSSIRTKTGAQEVRFRLVDEGGQTKLKAMPLKEA